MILRFPAIVDVPRAFQAELQDEADEAVEAIRDLKLLRENHEKRTFLITEYKPF